MDAQEKIKVLQHALKVHQSVLNLLPKWQKSLIQHANQAIFYGGEVNLSKEAQEVFKEKYTLYEQADPEAMMYGPLSPVPHAPLSYKTWLFNDLKLEKI